MLMSILNPEITGKHYEKGKQQPTENQKNTKSLLSQIVRALHPFSRHLLQCLFDLSFSKISTTTNFDLKTEFGHETR